MPEVGGPKVDQAIRDTHRQGGIFILNHSGQDAVVALGIYFLESGFLHSGKILDYLLAVLRGLPTASFPDEVQCIAVGSGMSRD